MYRTACGLLLALSALFAIAPVAAATDGCGPRAGRIVSLQGSVEVYPAGETHWVKTSMDQALCPGDQIKAGPDSRVSVLLPNQTVIRLDENTTVTYVQAAPDRPSFIEVINGLLHILTRTRDSLDIKTPVVNANVKGTELVLRVGAQQTDLWVLEGEVDFNNAQGKLAVNAGQAATATAGTAPQYRVLVRPVDAVQWALYYPPILDRRGVAALTDPHVPEMRRVLNLFRAGHFAEALAATDTVPEERRNLDFFNLRAGLRLSVGRVAGAGEDIAESLRRKPGDATALALKSVVAVAQNRKNEALDLAQAAERGDPISPTAQIALSYAYQSRFDLENAVIHAQKGAELAPDNGLAWARVAELELAHGNSEASLEAAKKAVVLEPRLARTQSVVGYAELADVQLDAASEAFQQAIKLDSADPLPRLGMGLVEVRRGNLKEGVEQLEIAASLDPANPVVRNYLGKAYYEQKRDILVEREFAGAKALDPMDPTAWFYDAIFKQSVNRPIEALADLEKATELNGNKAVYRSKFLLDEDAAVRGVNLARIYNEIGFGQRGFFEGFKAVSTAPEEFSSHLLLANTYGILPRHEVAQASELLQAQLLQPTNISVLPQVLLGIGTPQTTSSIRNANTQLITPPGALQGAGPTRFSFNEFNPAFLRNGLAFQLDTVGGTQGTFANSAVVSLVQDRFSGSLAQFHGQTNGFARNQDSNSDLYNAFAQFAATPDLRLQGDFRYRESDTGFADEESTITGFRILRNYRQRAREVGGRLGLHYQLNQHNNFIGSFVYQSANITNSGNESVTIENGALSFKSPVTFDSGVKSDQYGADSQHLYRSEKFGAIIGANFTNIESDYSYQFNDRSPPIKSGSKGATGYVYAPINALTNLNLMLGASYDWTQASNLLNANRDTNRINPKLGISWSLTDSTTLRAAAFGTLRRPLVGNQTLEPTQLAGFNQFFNDPDGTKAWRYGAGIDHRVSTKLFLGGEMSWRDVSRPNQGFNDRTGNPQDKIREALHRAYVYWAPTDRLTLGAEYQFEQIIRNDVPTFLSDKEITTHQVPLTLTYYDPSGLFGRIAGTHVRQQLTSRQSIDSFVNPNSFLKSKENFWTLDATIGYRLPKRYGLISVDFQNLLDEQFRFQDNLDSAFIQSTRFSPGRAIFGRINLWFY